MGMTLADVTADLSSLILLSIKLHIFLSFIEWWAFQETDTVSVLWYHVWAVFFEKTRCVLSKVGALVLLRFPTCLVNGAVFLDTPDCVFSGRSLENGTIDQLFPWIGGCSCSRVPVAINVTFCAAGFSWAFWTSHCFDFLSEWSYLLLQSDDNFELLPCTRWTK